MKLNIGKNIKKYRKINNLSQTELGVKLGVANQTVSSWELDRTEPPIDIIEKMAIIFDCKKSDILGIEKSNVPVFESEHIELIKLYSILNDEQKASVMNLLRSFVN